MTLTSVQVQDLYLEIQCRLGALIAGASPTHQKELLKISMDLLKVKREWVGVVDEVGT